MEGVDWGRIVRAVLGVYVAVSVVGFVIGFSLAGGSGGRRLVAGLIGVAMGWLLVWFVILLVAVPRAIWATAHRTAQVEPIPPPRGSGRSG